MPRQGSRPPVRELDADARGRPAGRMMRFHKGDPMSQALWTAVDRYISDICLAPDPALDAALRNSTAGGLPGINVSPNQGKFLHLLARISGAKKILEIGTLGGYSTIWLARALPPGGELITLEVDAKHAQVARGNIVRAGLEKVVDIRLGRAIEILPKLSAEG